MAVKSIQKIAPIIQEMNLVMIVETLASMVVDSNKKEVRDIFSLAIRSTIDELKDASANNMIKAVYPKLFKGLPNNQNKKEEVQAEVLDILAEIFKKFGNLLLKNNNLVNKDQLMVQIIDLIQSSNREVRKRATTCVGQFSIILNMKQLQKLVRILIDRLKNFI